MHELYEYTAALAKKIAQDVAQFKTALEGLKTTKKTYKMVISEQ